MREIPAILRDTSPGAGEMGCTSRTSSVSIVAKRDASLEIAEKHENQIVGVRTEGVPEFAQIRDLGSRPAQRARCGSWAVQIQV